MADVSSTPPAPAPDVTVSILSFNTRDLLRRCLQSLYAPESPDVRAAWEEAGRPLDESGSERVTFEVVVVDQVSLDRSAEMVAEEFPQVKLLHLQRNLGF